MSEYCIYLRKSRADFEAEQRGEGETLAMHRTTLMSLARKLNLSVTKIYQEIVSGDTIAARPEMQKLLDDVNDGKWAGVLVMEIERLARGDTMDQGLVAQSFKYSGTKIITPIKTYDPADEFDEEYFEFGLFMSRREYKTINRRLQRGREAAAAAGKWLAQAPYGYKKKKLENDKGYTLEIDPVPAGHVKLMFEWYVNGAEINGEFRRLGIQAIARRLNEMGVPSYRHDYWQKETIRDIIINPAYAGLVRWGYRKQVKKMVDGKPIKSRPIANSDCILSEGLHEALISREMYDKAQEIIKSHGITPVRYDKQIKSPLSGIVTCAKCGRKMVLRKATTPNKPDYLVCHARSCDNVSTPIRLVEERLLYILATWVNDYQVTAASKERDVGAESAALENTLAGLREELATLNKQQQTAYTLVEQGVYTPEVFLERSRDISYQIEQKKKSIADIESALKNAGAEAIAKNEFIPKVEHLLDVYGELNSPLDKNTLLKEVVSGAVYLKEHSGSFRGHSADEFELTVYPAVPLT